MGLIGHDLSQEAEYRQLAQLIFEAGLSTCDDCNQISGRGIGMSPVRSLARELGGGIRIELDADQPAGTAVRFVIQILLDRTRVLKQVFLKSA